MPISIASVMAEAILIINTQHINLYREAITQRRFYEELMKIFQFHQLSSDTQLSGFLAQRL